MRLGVASKLALLLGGLAAASTGLALLIQDRTLNSDLREAAERRLARAARAGDRLLADHLRGVVERYEAISQAPEFRANLEVRHEPTLTFFANQIAERQGAAAIAFLDDAGVIVARSGRPALVRAGRARLQPAAHQGQDICVSTSDNDSAFAASRQTRFGPCRFPTGGAEATLLSVDSVLFVAAAVPLRTGALLAGSVLALEPITPDAMAAWSEVLGAPLTVRSPGSLPPDQLVEPVRFFPGFAVRVSTPYEAERRAVARARRNLVLSGLGALVLAIAIGVLLAHRFARPILRMRRVAEAVGSGAPKLDLDVRRRDELGDLGRAFADMVARIRDGEMRLARAQRMARFSNWSLDLETLEVHGGAEFRRLFGLNGDREIGWQDLIARIHCDDRENFVAALDRARLPRGAFRTDVRVETAAGSHRILHLRGQPADDGQIRRVEASAQDITELYNSARQIEYLSLHDPVTGLGNRQYLFDRVASDFSRSHRSSACRAGFLISLNDVAGLAGTIGHAFADDVMCEVARRLVEALASDHRRERRRALGASESCAVRLGDAEFMVVEAVRDRREARAVARLVLRKLVEAYRIEDEEIHLTVSVGVSLWEDVADGMESLVRQCRTALQSGGSGDRDQVHFYHESLRHEASRRRKMVRSLRRAIEGGELELHYQPRVQPATGRIVAVEALARWHSDEFGNVSPAEFIPLAEDTGLIQPLSDWCLRTAVDDILRWEDRRLRDLRISINISPQQLAPGIVENILSLRGPVDPRRLEFEVTEGAVIQSPDRALGLLTELGECGFRIALDDFGTGYSSLSYIRRLPIHTVKIDQSFIKEMDSSDEAMSITWAIIMMCQAVHLEAVAEGVETEAQRTQLVELGCEEAQGYLFARPMAVADLENLLVEQGLLEVSQGVT